MKYSTLRRVAFWLGVLSALVGAAGLATSILLAVGAATLLARLVMLFGGLIATALIALATLGLSRLLYLSADIGDEVDSLLALTRDKRPE